MDAFKSEIILPGVPPIENGEIPSQLVLPGQVIYLDSDLLDWGGLLRHVEMFHENLTLKELEENQNTTVYLSGEYFYPYVGKWGSVSTSHSVGIYWDEIGHSPIKLDPLTDEDKEQYKIFGKLIRTDVDHITFLANANALKIDNLPETSRAFLPPPKASDDILKRLIKLAIMEKRIALDDYKDNFVDKNALFNFKQVLKGDSRLSMLLFDRGTNALNLKYSIILEEKDPEHSLGKPIKRIMVTSEDTYDM